MIYEIDDAKTIKKIAELCDVEGEEESRVVRRLEVLDWIEPVRLLGR